MQYLRRNSRLFLFIILSVFSLYSLIVLFKALESINTDNSLALLASQFLHGHISLAPARDMPLGDISKFHGKYYLYFAPLASVILMPFIALFGKSFPQLTLGIGSLFVSFCAVYKICKTFTFSKLNALYLALFFTFSTVMLSASIINISAYQVEVLGVPFVLLGLNEYFNRKRGLLIGIYFACALLTRNLLGIGLLFFLLEWLQRRLSGRELVRILVPVVIAGLLLGIYNIVRFHSPIETGYQYNITLRSYPLSLNLMHGYISLSHIPANLYSLFIMPPNPVLINPHGFFLIYPYLKASPWGMAIWYTSPLFLVLLYKVRKGTYTYSAAITAICLAVPLLLYYSIGFAQFGYRYALDFLPFLFIVLLHSLAADITKKEIALIVIGVVFNCIYLASQWGIYPVIGILH